MDCTSTLLSTSSSDTALYQDPTFAPSILSVSIYLSFRSKIQTDLKGILVSFADS